MYKLIAIMGQRSNIIFVDRVLIMIVKFHINYGSMGLVGDDSVFVCIRYNLAVTKLMKTCGVTHVKLIN